MNTNDDGFRLEHTVAFYQDPLLIAYNALKEENISLRQKIQTITDQHIFDLRTVDGYHTKIGELDKTIANLKLENDLLKKENMELLTHLDSLQKKYEMLQAHNDQKEAKRRRRITLGQVSYTLEEVFVRSVLSPTRKGKERVRMVDVKNKREHLHLSNTEIQNWEKFEQKVLESGRFDGNIDYFIRAVKHLKNKHGTEDMKNTTKTQLIGFARDQFAKSKKYEFDDARDLIIILSEMSSDPNHPLKQKCCFPEP
ncbi:hypothetical protein AKO1_008307 [Acrasis kona]|uniref:Uncharacterized protein n=1 Tax=Acrasis kona TaxID=1008807 RepID=A0AAW2YPC6_9EUKA